MYTLDKNNRIRLDGKVVKLDSLPTSKKFTTDAGPCVVVARSLQERKALALADKPEDIEGFNEALKLARANT